MTERLRLGNEPRALAIVGGRVWAAVAATGAGHRGGTLRIVDGQCDRRPRRAIRPRATTAERVDAAEHRLRRARPRSGAPAAGGRRQVVPNLAQALPAPSDGGQDVHVRDATRGALLDRAEVRPSDVKRGIERSLRAEPAAFGLLGGITSVEADERSGTVVIPARAARPGLPLPARVAVRRGRAARSGGAAGHRAPATGPVPDRGLDRAAGSGSSATRYYRIWSRARKAGRISGRHRGTFSVGAGEAVAAIRSGAADCALVDLRARPDHVRRRDPGLLREPVPADIVGVPEHARAAVRRRRRPPGREPRDRPGRRGHRGRRRVRRRAPATSSRRRSPGYGRPARRADLPRLAGSSRARAPAARGSPCGTAARLHLAEPGHRRGAARARLSHPRAQDVDGALLRQAGESTKPRADRPFGVDGRLPSASTFLTARSRARTFPRPSRDANYSRFCDRARDALMRRATARAGERSARRRRALGSGGAPRARRGAGRPARSTRSPRVVSARVPQRQYSPQWGSCSTRRGCAGQRSDRPGEARVRVRRRETAGAHAAPHEQRRGTAPPRGAASGPRPRPSVASARRGRTTRPRRRRPPRARRRRPGRSARSPRATPGAALERQRRVGQQAARVAARRRRPRTPSSVTSPPPSQAPSSAAAQSCACRRTARAPGRRRHAVARQQAPRRRRRRAARSAAARRLRRVVGARPAGPPRPARRRAARCLRRRRRS